MTWTILSFGRHAGKSLPQVILSDPDWFFWMLPKFYGRLAVEAKDLARKATAIKVPYAGERRRDVVYHFEEGGKFIGFTLVDANKSIYDKWCTRRPYLDLSWVSRHKRYAKGGCRELIRDFRRYYFGENTRLTKERCEAFFSDEDNFVKCGSYAKRADVGHSSVRENQPMV
jgi:hypothetical protein